MQGPPCPTCHKLTEFIGVQPSMRDDVCVEVYMCREHMTRFEAPIVRNRHDNDYKCIDDCL